MPNPTSKLICVGDLHAHFDQWMLLYDNLIEQADFVPERDTLVQLGDIVDGGSQAKQTVKWCMEMSARYPHWVFLKGNHCDLMLDALRYNQRIYGSYDLWWMQGGRETAKSYQPQDASEYERAIMQPLDYIPAEHLDWLEARPLYHETDRYIFVHAGLRPGIPLGEQDREDMLWIRESFFESRYNFGRPVVFGHTPFSEPLVIRDRVSPDPVKPIIAIGVDTMFHNSGKLTAVELSGPEPVFYFQPALES
jgi:serine/threonine protein phosphatase 1